MKLPILDVVFDACGDLLARPVMFLKLAAVALPVAILLPELLLQLGMTASSDDVALWRAICLLPFAGFALIWLRLSIGQVRSGAGPLPAGQLAIYLATGAAFLSLLWPAATLYPLAIARFLDLGRVGMLADPGGWVNGIVAALLLIPAACYLLMRTSLILPATARRQPLDLRAAWAATAGNGWRLIAAGLLATLPLLLLSLVLHSDIVSLGASFQTPLDRMAFRLIAGPIELAAAALFMNVLARAHLNLPGEPSAQDQTVLRLG